MELVETVELVVVRDVSGAVINIGPWDEQVMEVVDSNPPRFEATNPLPEGATQAVEPVGIYSDGSRRAINP